MKIPSMIRLAVAALALGTSAPIALAATDAELREQLLGKWWQEPTCTGGSLIFASDGTFIYAQAGFETKGTWSIADGVLSGTREDGGAQPDARLAFTGDTMTMTETGEEQRAGVLERCAS